MLRLNLPKGLKNYPKRKEIMAAIECLPGFDPHADTGGAEFEWRTAADWVWLWENTITHIEGPLAGQKYKLEPHEKGILANVKGWIHPKTGLRRFKTVLYFIPQGNSKTTFAAGWVALDLAFDKEPNAQIVGTASTREQAGLLKRIVAGMAENDKILDGKLERYQNSVVCGNRTYKTISADANSAHGMNIYLAVNDEVHAHKSADFLQVVRKKSRKRPNSLEIFITTADFIRESMCNTLYDLAKKVLEGSVSMPSFLPAVWEITPEEMVEDPECWLDPAMWAKANPQLGKAVAYEDFELMAHEAAESPALQAEFQRLCLNIRTQSKNKLINISNWINICSEDICLDDYQGQMPAGVGLDLGQTSDFTVMCVLYDFKDTEREEHKYAAFWWYWVPEVTARSREAQKSGAIYETWARMGHMKLTQGDETDYNEIKRDIVEMAPRLGVRRIAIDRLFQGAQLAQDLGDEGLEMVDFGQGFISMAAPTIEYLKAINTGRFQHGGNPVALWEAGNVESKQDAAGNIKPDKGKSGDKIDGQVAAIMALGMAMAREDPPESLLEKLGGVQYV